MVNSMLLFIAYLVVMNLIAFGLMGLDKHRAIHQEWRISEKALFASAIFGGSIGSIVGMQVFRHKTKHWYFLFGMPLILILQCIGAWLIKYTM
ncbi:MAG: DUF1294 domain-containing protein [Lachnospiraceae bacterium]